MPCAREGAHSCKFLFCGLLMLRLHTEHECLWHLMCYRSTWLFTWNQVYSVFRFTLQSSHFALSLFHFFPLGSRNFSFPFYVSAKTCIFSLVTRKKANDCLSFSQSGSLRFCKRKERRRIVISNHHNNVTILGGKKWQQVKMVCSVAGGIFFLQMTVDPKITTQLEKDLDPWNMRGRTKRIKRKR